MKRTPSLTYTFPHGGFPTLCHTLLNPTYLSTPLMGARDGVVKAALSATLPNDPCGEKIPLGAVRSSVTRIDVLIHHFDDSCCEWHGDRRSFE